MTPTLIYRDNTDATGRNTIVRLAYPSSEFCLSGPDHPLLDSRAGEPLLLLHGFPTASWDWHYLWVPLTQRFRVVACDMLGFGDSAKPLDHDYSLMEQADLQQALLAHLNIDQPVHLLAHDYGGTVAQELLARHCEQRIEIASCAFLNSGLFPECYRSCWCKSCCSAPRLAGVPQLWAR